MLVGAVLLRLTLNGTYARYVRADMKPFLIVAGVAVLALGAVTLVNAVRGVQPVDAHDHHHHGHGLGVGWLLLAPIAALLLVAPPTLGSFGVGRTASVDIRSGGVVFPPLPRGNGPAQMSLLEFGERAYDHGGASFRGAAVQLTGFVAAADADGFRLARYQIACCAADALPMVVRVDTEGGKPARDEWVTVTGTFERLAGQVPELSATSVVEIPAPKDPYE
jgi:uncharacterized repeat protein (TIGR03943 family)